jgi:hypothetical protein
MADPGTILQHDSFHGPLFIVGMPRSGTKLLRDLLCGHPLVRIPRIETEFFPMLARYVDARGGTLDSRDSFAQFYRWIRRLPYFLYQQELGRTIPEGTWFDSGGPRTAACLFEALVRWDVGAPFGSPVIWGDKSPSYVTQVAYLATHFPSARFVHIVRDARDQALSSQTVWGKDPLRAAQRWADDVRSGLEQGRSLGARHCWVRYEDLTGNAEGVIGQLCVFLGIGFVPSMLSLARPSENLGTTRGATTVVRGNTGMFRNGMDARTVVAIERIAGSLLRELGYEVENAGTPVRLSAASMRMRQAKDFMALVNRYRVQVGWRRALLFHLRYRHVTSAGSGERN